MTAIPLLVPGSLVIILVAIAAAPPVGRKLGVRPWVAALLLFGVGLILVATLTPGNGALFRGLPSSGTCDLSRVTVAPLRDLLRPSAASLNVLLFVPLGIATGLLPRTRRSFAVVAFAVLLTFMVEGIQLLVPALGRACQSADIVDNLMGLGIGAFVGIGLRLVTSGHPEVTSGT